MTDQIPIRADVPVDMHPDVLSPHAERLDPGSLAAGRDALGAMYQTFGGIEDAQKALQAGAGKAVRRQYPDGRSDYLGDLRIDGSKLVRFTGREEEFAAAAETAFNRTAAQVDARVKQLQTARERLADKVDAALAFEDGRSAEGVAVAAEIRSHIARLAEGERLDFLQRAIEAEDRRTLSAVLGAPPYLSGLDQRASESIRDRAARAWAPDTVAGLEAMDATIDRVMAAGARFVERYAKVKEMAEGPAAEASKKLGRLREGE